MRLWIVGVVVLLGLSVGADQACGQFLEFDTELVSLNLMGGPFGIPLASDPGNDLGDSVDGWGFVMSQVAVTLSSQRPANPGPRSYGKAFAFPGGPAAEGGHGQGQPPIDPADWDGEEFFIESFFDVFFDITVTDVDDRPGRDYMGLSDGIALQVYDVGPADMGSYYTTIFDKDAPNFGLIPPPEEEPYIGHFLIEIPLGADINQNGEDDKLKFTLATHSVGEENRSWIELPDGTIVDSFDSAATLEGAIVDMSADPPFTIGTADNPLTGPASAGSTLLNPVIPEPSTFVLLGMGAVGLLAYAWRKRRWR